MLPASRAAFHRKCQELVQSQDYLVQTLRSGPVRVDEPWVLQGFREYYARDHHKRPAIDGADRVEWHRTTKRDGTFVMVCGSQRVSVSAQCKPVDVKRDVKKACRDSVKCQVDAVRTRPGTEIDHCNEGGMKQLIDDWLASTAHDVAQHLLHNNVLDSALTFREGFITFREPVLSEWRAYHEAHAELQELSPEEHKRVTSSRRR